MLYHKTPIEIIEEFQSPVSGILEMPGKSINGISATLEKYRKAFDIIWPDNYNRGDKFKLGNYNKNINFKTGNFTLVMCRLFIHSMGKNIKATTSVFKTKGFKTASNYYYRLIIPLKKKYDIHFSIQYSSFASDLINSSSEGTMAIIDGDQLQVCILTEKERFYLSIESRVKQTYKSFSEKAHSLINGLGYITGYLPTDAGYYFAYSSKTMEKPVQFYFTEWRNSIQSMYQPIYSNPFGYMRNDKQADKLYKKNVLRPMLITEFSTLCNKLYNSREFTGVIILILEASIASLLFMPGGYAIALETMTALIIGDAKIERSLIPDKKTRNRILNGFKAIIEAESDNLTTENKGALISRIAQLPQGTNISRLRAPFDILNITLLEADLKVIESRNAFLHGRVPNLGISNIKNKDAREGKVLFYASLRLYTLLNRMILKWVGYENYILNHVKIQELDLRMKVNEKHYYKD